MDPSQYKNPGPNAFAKRAVTSKPAEDEFQSSPGSEALRESHIPIRPGSALGSRPPTRGSRTPTRSPTTPSQARETARTPTTDGFSRRTTPTQGSQFSHTSGHGPSIERRASPLAEVDADSTSQRTKSSLAGPNFDHSLGFRKKLSKDMSPSESEKADKKPLIERLMHPTHRPQPSHSGSEDFPKQELGVSPKAAKILGASSTLGEPSTKAHSERELQDTQIRSDMPSKAAKLLGASDLSKIPEGVRDRMIMENPVTKLSDLPIHPSLRADSVSAIEPAQTPLRGSGSTTAASAGQSSKTPTGVADRPSKESISGSSKTHPLIPVRSIRRSLGNIPFVANFRRQSIKGRQELFEAASAGLSKQTTRESDNGDPPTPPSKTESQIGRASQARRVASDDAISSNRSVMLDQSQYDAGGDAEQDPEIKQVHMNVPRVISRHDQQIKSMAGSFRSRVTGTSPTDVAGLASPTSPTFGSESGEGPSTQHKHAVTVHPRPTKPNLSPADVQFPTDARTTYTQSIYDNSVQGELDANKASSERQHVQDNEQSEDPAEWNNESIMSFLEDYDNKSDDSRLCPSPLHVQSRTASVDHSNTLRVPSAESSRARAQGELSRASTSTSAEVPLMLENRTFQPVSRIPRAGLQSGRSSNTSNDPINATGNDDAGVAARRGRSTSRSRHPLHLDDNTTFRLPTVREILQPSPSPTESSGPPRDGSTPEEPREKNSVKDLVEDMKRAHALIDAISRASAESLRERADLEARVHQQRQSLEQESREMRTKLDSLVREARALTAATRVAVESGRSESAALFTSFRERTEEQLDSARGEVSTLLEGELEELRRVTEQLAADAHHQRELARADIVRRLDQSDARVSSALAEMRQSIEATRAMVMAMCGSEGSPATLERARRFRQELDAASPLKPWDLTPRSPSFPSTLSQPERNHFVDQSGGAVAARRHVSAPAIL